MNYWVIASWIFVALLTAVNVFVFLKLKKASDMMMSMSGMMGNMKGGMPKAGAGGQPQMPPNLQAMMGQMNSPQMQQQMKAAMDMLSQMQNNNKKR